jgi:hypothetical protein
MRWFFLQWPESASLAYAAKGAIERFHLFDTFWGPIIAGRWEAGNGQAAQGTSDRIIQSPVSP